MHTKGRLTVPHSTYLDYFPYSSPFVWCTIVSVLFLVASAPFSIRQSFSAVRNEADDASAATVKDAPERHERAHNTTLEY